MRGVLFAPSAVGIIPAGAGQFGGAIDAIPIRGIVTSKIVESPGDAHFAEHGEIGGGIGAVGIEERAVPIEKDALNFSVWASAHFGGVRLAESNAYAVGRLHTRD